MLGKNTIAVVIVAVVGFALMGLQPSPSALQIAQERPRQAQASLAFDPPQVLSAELEIPRGSKGTTKGVLNVLFAPDPRLKDTVTLTLDDHQVVLRRIKTMRPALLEIPTKRFLLAEQSGRNASLGVQFRGEITVHQQDVDRLASSATFSANQRPVRVVEQRAVLATIKPPVLRKVLLPLDRIRIQLPIWFQPIDVDPAKTLMITDPSVVGDPSRTYDPCTDSGAPAGKWTFNHLMTAMANTAQTGIDPADFTRKWLETWLSPQTIGADIVPARAEMQRMILDPWPKQPGDPTKLDLTKSPFKLVAIVNRIDLSDNPIYGGGNAGEGRFIFAAVDRSTANCQTARFLVIFEYGVPKRGCRAVRSYAREWVALDTLALGSPAYNQALEHLTDQFSEANLNPSKANGSALNQLRTNEIALVIQTPQLKWEFREFHLNGGPGSSSQLIPSPLVKNPRSNTNRTTDITTFVNTNTTDVLNQTHQVLAPLQGGGDRYDSDTFWDGERTPPFNNPPQGPAVILNAEARHKFSLSTCSGCHGGETGTIFTHVSQDGALSRFLTSDSPEVAIPDPGQPLPGGGPWLTERTFEDLAERERKLATLANSPCFMLLNFRRPKFVH